MSNTALFPLGRVQATGGAIAVLAEAQEDATTYLVKHVIGDWSEMDEEDQQENRYSVDKQRWQTVLLCFYLQDTSRHRGRCIRPEREVG